MGKGFLKIQMYVGDYALDGLSMTVMIMKNGATIYTLATDEHGSTGRIELDAPDLSAGSLAEGEELFETYDVVVPAAHGFMKVSVYGVQIFDGITSILNIHLEPLLEGGPEESTIHVPRERGVTGEIEEPGGAVEPTVPTTPTAPAPEPVVPAPVVPTPAAPAPVAPAPVAPAPTAPAAPAAPAESEMTDAAAELGSAPELITEVFKQLIPTSHLSHASRNSRGLDIVDLLLVLILLRR